MAGFESQEAAALAEAQELLKLQAGASSDAFAVIVRRRLDEIKAYSTPLWYATCRGTLKAFEDWNGLPISHITAQLIRDRLFEIARKRGNGVANRCLVILKSVFGLAVRDAVISRNPMIGIRKFPVERGRKVIPRREDIDRVIAAAEPLDQAYLITILLTGARVGEINHLTWADVDIEHRCIRLWTRKKRGGDRKYRTVHMTPRVAEALRYAKSACPGRSPWVFPNPVMVRDYPDKPGTWFYRYRDKFLKTLCRRLGIPVFTYHCLRHYTASALDEAGVPLASIQKILGHERATTTDGYLQDLGRAETSLDILERRE